MDWIGGLQQAIDYVEEHITEPIDYEKAAGQAFSSGFHFQRVFSILCGFTLGDYIRWRRLSLAGRELAEQKGKVLDTALKYGYDSPESFARAFTRFHGITPSEAKNGGALKTFSRLSVKITLYGGPTMDYRMETREAFDILVKKKSFPKNQEITSREIPDFWNSCHQDGTVKKLIGLIPEQDTFGLMGISRYDRNASDFEYGIGVHCKDNTPGQGEWTKERIPAHTWVVFRCVGTMPEAFLELYRYICTEFFPQSAYQPCGVEIEAYPSDDVKNPGYTCELWIAVEKK